MSDHVRWKKWLFAAIKLFVVVLLIWFVRGALQSAFDGLRKHTWELRPAWLVLAGACYILGLMPVPVFWHRVLLATGQEVSLFDTIRAWWVAQIAKYIPGKAMVLVVRTSMLRNPNVETTVLVVTVFVETLTMMAVGSLLSFIVIVALHWYELSALLATVHGWDDILRLSRDHTIIMTVAALALFVATALPTWPPLMKLLVKIMGVGKLNPTAADKLGRVPYRVFFAGWLIIACGWFVQGLGLWATLRSLDIDTPLTKVPMNTATLAMLTVAGFISFIPGGAGVREVVQTEMMFNDYGEGPAVIASLLWRLVMLVAELLISSILYLGGRRRSSQQRDERQTVPDIVPAK